MLVRLPHFLARGIENLLLTNTSRPAALPPMHLNCGLGVVEPEVNPGDLRSPRQESGFHGSGPILEP